MKTLNVYKSPEGQKQILQCYEKNLATWPVPKETMVIDNPIAQGFVIASGPKNAPPLVLFHGSGSNSLTWANESVELSKHFRLYAMDLPGEPGKSEARRYDWQGQEYMDWISMMLESLGIEECVMGGLSLGGGFALKYAANNRDRVKALVLISPGGIVPVKPDLKLIWYALQGKRGFEKMCRYLFPGVILDGPAAEFMALTAEHFNYNQGQPPQVSDEALKQLSIPVLYYAGGKDPLVNTKATLTRLKKHVAQLYARIYEDKGHLLLPLAKEIVKDLKNHL
ncbi:MAG: alpha/beta hydrolase [Spirochaetales bacterium]|nr:alpha/beta hydrolase [Spirochaetales bacterium]